MNREIKFMAWCTLDNKMYEGLGVLQLAWTGNYIPLQFIDRKDKNGVEIYEGFICKAEYVCPVCFDNEPHIIIGYIEQDVSSGTWMLDYGHGSMPVYVLLQDDENNIEVIGNIYQNPELLS